MKISKRQLKRIIREEKAKVIRETRDQADQNLKAYQDGYHGGAFTDLEQKLDTALYELQEMFVQVNGVHPQEAAEMVLDECARTLGVVR